MSMRHSWIFVLAVLTAGCTTTTTGGGTSAFEMVDTNGDGRVDIAEFRQQNLFPPYEQFFPEADANDDETLDPDEFHVARSLVYGAMGVGGANM
jgi:Ca2+-binding EF-hand superfamily protein